jgi:hypothetical protein
METGVANSLGHILDFYVDAIAKPKPLTLAIRQQCARLFGGFGFDTPILNAGHLDRRVEQFALSLGRASGHALGLTPSLVVG